MSKFEGIYKVLLSVLDNIFQNYGKVKKITFI